VFPEYPMMNDNPISIEIFKRFKHADIYSEYEQTIKMFLLLKNKKIIL